MNGGTPLIDKLLSTSPAQRSDLVPIKGQIGIQQPDAITDTEAAENDTRLPSRAAVGRQLGIDTGQSALPPTIPMATSRNDNARLSATARIISEILGTAPAKAEAVQGAAPLWADASAPETSLVAAALARNVAGSGLFYESHLLQFFSGQRSLAQLRQEPQANLLRQSVSDDPTLSPSPGDSRTGVGHAQAGIPVEAIPLVRQQLELLALSQFRWNGEAWPGAGMEWEITEQGHRRHGNTESGTETIACDWSTSLAMTLPRLGNLVLRLSLAKDGWRIDLAVAEAATLHSMRTASTQLRQRFSAAGLPVSAVQVAQLPQSGTDEDS
ncbi:hypothetical protein LT85_1146 [Collimonas arenae]|uniref:Flagellar hook-length control protein-like C-terminal domain-containing protein n=1 Tax=Collimonas arenae TaxID=279058 RepID=A0A0A1F9I1_9BURK|nr:flagellar hook-length control protein FliK [Collimonas arenae]AIY40304.1 hypothetical protein LT85_1146 [Collimonas arenae]